MVSLTFGEQVKIVLSRKGMTIKELAEKIEEKTGKKMSRQNLTQRLGRDNFQEQDMRMIAEILGCSFQLSIFASAEAAERASAIEEVMPTGEELDKLAVKKEKKEARLEERKAERDLTVGEIVDMLSVPVEESGVEAKEDKSIQDVQPAAASEESTDIEELQPETVELESADKEEVGEVEQRESPKEKKDEKKDSRISRLSKIVSAAKRQEMKQKESGFQPIKKRVDEEEDLEKGDVNPYTGHEYQSNSVRVHPKRIGYVQVYDRKEHKWTDMTEWAFLGFEERKKAAQGKKYEPPIYLD